MVTIAVVGGSFAGNKGAASMVRAVVDVCRDRWESPSISVLTPLPEEDRRFVRSDPDVELVPFRPRDIVTAGVAALAHRFSRGRLGHGDLAIRALEAADVVVDVSGISFVDGRGPATLVYNFLLMAVPLLIGRPVVKVAQAMGPFEGVMNRWAARRILPRMSGIGARGRATAKHLERLGLENWRLADDAAFLMQTTSDDQRWADVVSGDVPIAIVSPSMVVEEQDPSGDYGRVMTAVIDHLATRFDVLLVPHAARPGRPSGRLNDLPFCADLRQQVRQPDRCRIVGEDADPGELRALIGRAHVLVTSRFHAMISSLAVGTPVLVVGWSHKYREVLDEFGLSEWTIDFRRASVDRVLSDLERLLDRAPQIRERIHDELPRVLGRAAVNIELIEGALEGDIP